MNERALIWGDMAGCHVHPFPALLSQQVKYPLLIKTLALLEINPVPFTSQRLVLMVWLILMYHKRDRQAFRDCKKEFKEGIKRLLEDPGDL